MRFSVCCPAQIESPLEAARLAARLGVRVHTVAFGTTEGFIPGFEAHLFFARVDEETLRQMVQITKGDFFVH